MQKLSETDKSKILSDIGAMLDNVVYDKGFRDGLKSKKCVSNDVIRDFKDALSQKFRNNNTEYSIGFDNCLTDVLNEFNNFFGE